MLFLQPAPTLGQPLGAAARHRVRVGGAFGLQRPLGLAQPLAAIAAALKAGGQLVAARCAMDLVFGGVQVGRLLQDLAGNVLIAARRVMRRGGSDLGAVDRDDADVDEAGLRAQRQDLAEQLGDRVLLADAKPRDRGVIGRVVGGDDPEGDVVATTPLDRPRRTHPDGIGVDEQRDHHLRIVRRPTPPVLPIGRVERAQVHLRDRLQHEPREVILREPVAQTRRQQLLITVTTTRSSAP